MNRTIELTSPISLFVATPMYGAMCCGEYAMSMVNLGMSCATSGIGFEAATLYNSSILTWARNELARRFMTTRHTHLLFVDADIGFDAYDVFKMAAANKDIIGGVYPLKQIVWDRVHQAALSGVPPERLHLHANSRLPVRTRRPMSRSDEPFEVEGIGTGFMLIKREVLERLAETVPRYTDEDGNTGVPDLFATHIDDSGVMWSEDMNFCRLWRKQGGTVFAAPWTKMSHTGTHQFNGG